ILKWCSDVIMLFSPNVVLDGIHGLVIKGAAAVALFQWKVSMRSIRVDESCGEFECWTEHYLPAAIELARVTRGLPSAAAPPLKAHRWRNAEKFWLSWLDWSKLPLSSTSMRHFEPMVIFPVYSSVMSYGVEANNEKSVAETMKNAWDSAEQRIKKDPNTMAEIIRLIQQQVASGSNLMAFMVMQGSEKSGEL
ncbi:hypothetical protein FOL47_001761, partial [Perkinsus chesapeaki]